MATLASARAKWERNTAGSGVRWKSGTAGRGDAYCSGIARFLGVETCNPGIKAKWEAGTDAISAEDFQNSIVGKGAKWEEKMRRALVRG